MSYVRPPAKRPGAVMTTGVRSPFSRGDPFDTKPFAHPLSIRKTKSVWSYSPFSFSFAMKRPSSRSNQATMARLRFSLVR